MIGGQNCISGCNGPCPCPWCLCPKDKLSQVGRKTDFLRTKEIIELLAHTRLGHCPGCEMQIVAAADLTDKESQVPLCERNCAHPRLPAHMNQAGNTHLNTHFGVVPGQKVNYDLEPGDWSICLLHANLCIVGGLLQKTVLSQIDLLKDPQATHTQGDQIRALLLKNGV
jgi:hypothetical protein